MGKPDGANLRHYMIKVVIYYSRIEGTWGTETSKYPEEKKVKTIF